MNRDVQLILKDSMRAGHLPGESNMFGFLWENEWEGEIGNSRIIKRRLVGIEHSENLIVNAGLAGSASLLAGIIATPFRYLALGTSGTAPAAGNTALGAETTATGLARANLTPGSDITCIDGGGGFNNKIQWQKQFTNSSGGSVAVAEAGLFTASSGGTMYARGLIGPQTVTNGSSYQLLWQITHS